MTNQLDKLIARLQLPRHDAGYFVGGSGIGGVTADNRLYGGLVVAQAVVAAARTAADLHLHSMHAYFLRPGRPDKPIHLYVEQIKQGKNYQARQVQARQEDKVILQLMASFGPQITSAATHSDAMPSVPPPEGLLNRDEARGRKNWQDATIDVRLCDELTQNRPLPTSKSVWIKPAGLIPADPLLQLGVMVFASDRAFLSTAWRAHADLGQLQGASLDHSLWIHGPLDFNHWHLYQSHSPAAAMGRGLVQGAIFNQQGVRVASVAQEGTLSYLAHEHAAKS